MRRLIFLLAALALVRSDAGAVSQPSRLKTWGNEVLTAADLNAEFDQLHTWIEAQLLGSANALTIPNGDSMFVNGFTVNDTTYVTTAVFERGGGITRIGLAATPFDSIFASFLGVSDSLAMAAGDRAEFSWASADTLFGTTLIQGNWTWPDGYSLIFGKATPDTLTGNVLFTGSPTVPAGQVLTVAKIDADSTAGATRHAGLQTFAAGATVPAGQTLTAAKGDIDSLTGNVLFSAGWVTMATNPCFIVLNSASDDDQTGDGTGYTADFDSEVQDKGGNFATDTFTAPVTGMYSFGGGVHLGDIDAAHTTCIIQMITSNRTHYIAYWTDVPTVGALFIQTTTVLTDMDANDTAYISVTVGGSTKTIDVDVNSYCWGRLEQ